MSTNNQISPVGGNVAEIDLVKRFPPDQYNILVPISTIVQISPFHKISINIVSLDPDKDKGDVYPQSKKLAPTKRGLTKLMHAANISVSRIERTTPQGCQKCLAYATMSQKPLDCAKCNKRDNVAILVTLMVPNFAGGYRPVQASREWDYDDEHANAKDSYTHKFSQAIFDERHRFRVQLTETKALLRGVRSALSIQGTYTETELRKPFVVPVVSINYDEPELRQAIIDRYRNGQDTIFGESLSSVPMLPPGMVMDTSRTVQVNDFTNVPDHMEPEGSDGPPPGMDFDNMPDDIPECELCAAAIQPFNTKRRHWTADEWIERSHSAYGMLMCPQCSLQYERQKETEREAADQ